MSTDDYQLELKQLFPRLRTWYTPIIAARHGGAPFPQFWQDLESWPPLRMVKREYEVEMTGNHQTVAPTTTTTTTTQKKPRYDGPNHFTKISSSESYPLPPALSSLTLVQRRLMLARLQYEDVSAKLNDVANLALRAESDPNRPPSPDPIYDANGKRVNTREIRMRNEFTEERKRLIQELVRFATLAVPPQALQGEGGKPLVPAAAVITALSSATRSQIMRKIYIPVKDFPGFNFIGQIIGPRGNTQKRLEQETGCKIAIRGKGSVKAGRQSKPEDEMDELHVVITGDNEDGVSRAAARVEELLRPKDDSENAHKMEQLRELAIFNGTYRDMDACNWCGESGHKQWECPKKRAEGRSGIPGVRATGANSIGVVCAICGERSHPTMDCPKRHGGGGSGTASVGNVDATAAAAATLLPAEPAPVVVEDPEYLNFLAEM